MAKINAKRRKSYVRSYTQLIDKAEAKLADAILLQNQLQKAGVLAEGVDVKSMKEHLHNVRKYISHNNFTYKHANKLKEFVKDITRGNILEKSIQVNIARTRDAGMVRLPDGDEVMTYGKVRSLMRRHANNPSNITDREYEAISQIANALNTYYNSKAKTIEQMKEDAVNNRKVGDWSIGGDSLLLNDLAYSLDAEWYGRVNVETILNMMHGDLAVQVEQLYRTSEAGRQIHEELKAAKGDKWYDKFKSVVPTIINLIKMVQKGTEIPDRELKSLSNLENFMEEMGEQHYEEY